VSLLAMAVVVYPPPTWNRLFLMNIEGKKKQKLISITEYSKVLVNLNTYKMHLEIVKYKNHWIYLGARVADHKIRLL